MTRLKRLMQSSAARDHLNAWEDEGGALRHGAPASQSTRALAPPAAALDGSGEPRLGADHGIADRHTLMVLRMSLVLLVPLLGAFAIWAALSNQP